MIDNNLVGDIVRAFIDVVVKELKGLKLNVNNRHIQFGQ